MTCRRSSGFGSLSAGGWTGQKDAQAAVMCFEDVAELVVCEEKGTQADFGCGPEPNSPPKTDGAMVFLHEGGSEDDGVG